MMVEKSTHPSGRRQWKNSHDGLMGHRFEHTQIVVEVGNCSCPNGKCYDNYQQEVHTLVDYLQYNEYESIPMFASE